MDSDDRIPAPWERPLSRIRDQARAERAAAESGHDHGASMTPTDDPDGSAQEPRRLRREGDERLTVAELLARMEAEGQAPPTGPRRRRTAVPEPDPAPTQDAPPGPDTGIDRPALDHEAGLTAAGDGPADDPAGPGTDASAPDSAAADTPGPTDGEPPVPATPAAAFPPGSAALPELAADPPHKAPPVQVDPTGEPSAPGPRRSADWARRTGRALVALASVVAVVLLGAGWGYLRSTDGQ